MSRIFNRERYQGLKAELDREIRRIERARIARTLRTLRDQEKQTVRTFNNLIDYRLNRDRPSEVVERELINYIKEARVKVEANLKKINSNFKVPSDQNNYLLKIPIVDANGVSIRPIASVEQVHGNRQSNSESGSDRSVNDTSSNDTLSGSETENNLIVENLPENNLPV